MTEPTDFHYVGNELELFAQAKNWKRYWGALLQPYLRGDVLEIGAGLGANTRLLCNGRQRRWVCLEPDPRLHDQLRAAVKQTPLSSACEVRQGTTANLGADELFDAILYIDVLEHIEDDVGELRRAAAHLGNQGRLVVLAPAHPCLFSQFDAAVGHHRRYTRKSLKAAGGAAGNLRLERLAYLDCCGLLASWANRVLLRQSMPRLRQILIWDRVLVPLSRMFDPFFLHRLGKSVLAVWVKAGPSPDISRTL